MAPRSRAAPSATPQRMTRARSKTPLPSIDQTTSQAYGAQGKANLNQQLRQAAGFSQHFEETRAFAQAAAPAAPLAASRDGTIEPPQVPAPSQAANLRRRQQSPVPVAIREEVSEVESRRAPSPGRNATVLDHAAPYDGVGATIRAGIQRQMANPNSLSWFLLLCALMISFGFLFGLLSLFVPLPSALAPPKGSILSGLSTPTLHARDPLLDDLERRFAAVEGLTAEQRSFREEMQQNGLLLSRFETLDNWWRGLHAVNWFSVGLGARIDPHLTSPTKTQGPDGILYALYSSINPLYIAPNPPIAALTKWDEATECWCGTPDEKGQVQISVITHDTFYPNIVVFEHMPKEGTMQIEAAPREFEVWIDLGSEEVAQKLTRTYAKDPTYIAAGGCGESPGKTWFCVTKGEYDINKPNHVQRFHFWPWAYSERMQTNKFLIRANTNWGASHTCFYRIRMLGDTIDAKEDASIKAH